MKLSKTQLLSLRIILLFSVAIISTFIGDYLHSFLGDWKCQGSGLRIADIYGYTKCNYAESGFHDPTWHWGYRHWIYFIMCTCLFFIQGYNIIKNENTN